MVICNHAESKQVWFKSMPIWATACESYEHPPKFHDRRYKYNKLNNVGSNGRGREGILSHLHDSMNVVADFPS